jgi:hypothetical protein
MGLQASRIASQPAVGRRDVLGWKAPARVAYVDAANAAQSDSILRNPDV